MEKSIESIWKEGFIEDNALIAPKINDLYNQKSRHLIDKMMRMFRINFYYIIGLAAFLFLISTLGGVLWAGVILAVIFIPLITNSRKQMLKLEEIDKGDTSYEYLKSFDNWLKNSTAVFTRIYQFVYPIFFLTIIMAYWYSIPGQTVISKVIEDDPGAIQMWNGLPVWWTLGAIIIAVISGIFAKKLYRLDKGIVYGRVISKLEEMIAEMEELRKS